MNYNPTTKKCQVILERFHSLPHLVRLKQKTAKIGIKKTFLCGLTFN